MRPKRPDPDPEPPKPPARKRPAPLKLVTDLYAGTVATPKPAGLRLVPAASSPPPEPVPAPAAAVGGRKPAPARESSPPVFDNTPGRRTRAHYQQQLAKVRAALIAGTCKPTARAIGQCAGCNMQRAQAIATELVDAGTLERLPNRRLRVVASVAA